MNEFTTIKCPFCKKSELKILYKPSIIKSRTTRSSAAGTKRITYRTGGGYEILSNKCPSCGKSKKEIKSRLEGGARLSHEEIIRRAKEAGLPLKIKG